MYGFFAFRLDSRADAEDLTQQTFEQALRAWARFDPRRGTVGTWLLAIARNLLVDHYRRRAVRGGDVTIEEVGASELPSVDGPVVGGLEPELADAISELSDREREVLALRFGADLTGAEVAEATGLSAANVHQIVSRSLRRLRTALEG